MPRDSHSSERCPWLPNCAPRKPLRAPHFVPLAGVMVAEPFWLGTFSRRERLNVAEYCMRSAQD